MFTKLLEQFILLVAAFFGLWFLLSKIPFLEEEKIILLSNKQEAKLGELLIESLKHSEEFVDNAPNLVLALDSIKIKLCKANKIDPKSIKIHIIEHEDINAFALPGRHIIIYTGLIKDANKPEEVAGVMAHEIGHIEQRHVIKKLTKEVGITMLFAIVSGDAGFEIIRELTQLIASTAFDREQESQADSYAVKTLVKAHIDPESLASFLFRMSRQDSELAKHLEWFSTHPNSGDRTAAILKEKKRFKHIRSEVLLNQSWDELKKEIR